MRLLLIQCRCRHLTEKRGDHMVRVVLYSAIAATCQPPPQREPAGRRTAWSLTWAATIFCLSVVNNLFVSESVSPGSAISAR